MSFSISSRVKEYLKLNGNTNDTFIGHLIDDVTTEIESYCGQPIEQVSIILKKLQIVDDTVILPFTVPVVIMSIEYTLPFENSYSTLEPTEYEFYYDGYVPMIWFRNGIDDEYTWKITVAAGYTPSDIPKEILSVAIEMVAIKFKESVVGEDRLGKQSISTGMSGSNSTTTFKDLLPSWKAKLQKYKVYPS